MKVAIVVLACLALLAVYSPLRTAGFVYEDHKHVKGFMNAPASLWPRPLFAWSWYVQRHQPPIAFHAVNLGLFALVGGLVYLFVSGLGLSALASLYAALFVLLHASSVETVAYLSARPELFGALGILGACVLTAHCRRWWRWPGIALCVALGIAGKETAAIALVLIPLTLWVTRQPWRLVACLCVFLLAAGVTWYGGPAYLVRAGESAGLEVDALPWLLTQASATYQHLGLALTGTGHTVDPDYDILTHGWHLTALAALISLAALTWHLRHQRPLVSFGLAWTLLSVAPRLFLQTPRSNLNDHQFFVPFLGLVMAAAAWWDGWQQNAT